MFSRNAFFTCVKPPVVTGSFVERDPATGNLTLDGVRWRFAGSNSGHLGLTSANNAYGGTVNADGRHLATHTEIDAVLDSLEDMNANCIRAYGQVMSVGATDTCMPTLGAYNAAAFEPADYLLQQCAIRGIKVMFPLVDNYTYAGMNGKYWWCTASGVTPDGDGTQFFTNSTVIANFKSFVSYVVNRVNAYTGIRYGDDPTIFAWETGNELNTGTSGVSMNTWTGDIATYIKTTCGAQQLVADGRYGIVGSDNVTTDSVQLALTDVDMYSTHCYDQWRTPENVELQGTAAHAAGKAFFVGEATIYDTASNWTLAKMLSKCETSTKIDGNMPWQLLSPLTNWGDGYTYHYPGDNANMISRVNRLKGSAADMISKVQKVEVVSYANDSAGSINDRSLTFGTEWTPKTDDLVLFFVGCSTNTGMLVPSGWFNPLGGTTVSATSVNTLVVLGHWVTSGEQTAVTRSYAANDFIGNSSGNVVGVVLRGVDTAAPVDSLATGVGSSPTTTHTIPALTSLLSDSYVLGCVVKDSTGLPSPSPEYSTVWYSDQNVSTWVGEYNNRSTGVDIAASNLTASSSDEFAACAIAFKAA